MHKKRTRIQDVARAAGVHSSTVSRALNPRTRVLVSQAVAERIESLARKLGYSPDLAASGLRTRRSATIGVLIPDIANPVFPLILRGIEATLAEAGYTAIIANTDGDAARARAAIERLAARRIDGAIIATATRRDALIEQCRSLGLPAVLVNRSSDGGRVSAVINDDRAGIALAVGHLLALGHRAIGHVAGPGNISTGQGRRAGFVAAIKAQGLGPPPIAAADSYTIAAGERACARLFATRQSFSAIVAANDLLALGCYDELKRRGLACPRDVSVTGFNDMAFADRFDPPLTSVRIQHRLMGEEAARLLLAQIAKPRTPIQEIKLQPELIVRGSTAAPRLADSA
ncbi:MAG TPA: LacI family DNA-binding transcriptional regulator [Burkholderiales bacterium]